MFLFFFVSCLWVCVLMVLGGVLCDNVFCFWCGCSFGEFEGEGFLEGDLLVICFIGFCGFFSYK